MAENLADPTPQVSVQVIDSGTIISEVDKDARTKQDLNTSNPLGIVKEYIESSQLKDKQRTYCGEKTFSCNWKDCDKVLSRLSALKRHEKQQ